MQRPKQSCDDPCDADTTAVNKVETEQLETMQRAAEKQVKYAGAEIRRRNREALTGRANPLSADSGSIRRLGANCGRGHLSQ